MIGASSGGCVCLWQCTDLGLEVNYVGNSVEPESRTNGGVGSFCVLLKESDLSSWWRGDAGYIF